MRMEANPKHREAPIWPTSFPINIRPMFWRPSDSAPLSSRGLIIYHWPFLTEEASVKRPAFSGESATLLCCFRFLGLACFAPARITLDLKRSLNAPSMITSLTPPPTPPSRPLLCCACVLLRDQNPAKEREVICAIDNRRDQFDFHIHTHVNLVNQSVPHSETKRP